MSSQKWYAVSARRTSFEVDRHSCFCTLDDDDDGGVDSLVADWERMSKLGVVIGESEGVLGESGKSERCDGVLCGGGMIWAGWMFFSPYGWGEEGVLDCFAFSWGGFFICFSPFLSYWVPTIPTSFQIYGVIHRFNLFSLYFDFLSCRRWWWCCCFFRCCSCNSSYSISTSGRYWCFIIWCFDGALLFFRPFVLGSTPRLCRGGPQCLVWGFCLLLASSLYLLLLLLLLQLRPQHLLLSLWWSFEGRIWRNAPVVCNFNTGASYPQRLPSLSGSHTPLCEV